MQIMEVYKEPNIELTGGRRDIDEVMDRLKNALLESHDEINHLRVRINDLELERKDLCCAINDGVSELLSNVRIEQNTPDRSWVLGRNESDVSLTTRRG